MTTLEILGTVGYSVAALLFLALFLLLVTVWHERLVGGVLMLAS